MPQSLETRLGQNGLEYHHDQLGHIATKMVAGVRFMLVPTEGRPMEATKRIFSNPYAVPGIGSETADWMALALAAELMEEA